MMYDRPSQGDLSQERDGKSCESQGVEPYLRSALRRSDQLSYPLIWGVSAPLRISFYTLKWFIPHRCVWRYAEYLYSAYPKCESKNSVNTLRKIIVVWLFQVLNSGERKLNILNLLYFGFGNRHPCHYSFLRTYVCCCGKGEIRTPGPFRIVGFQDRWFKPLTHLTLLPSGEGYCVLCF